MCYVAIAFIAHLGIRFCLKLDTSSVESPKFAGLESIASVPRLGMLSIIRPLKNVECVQIVKEMEGLRRLFAKYSVIYAKMSVCV